MSWTLSDPNRARADYEAGDSRFDQVRAYAGGDTDFGIYLYVSNEVCRTMVGVGIFDLSDYDWRGAYDSAVPPRTAAAAAIAADDTFGAMR